MQGHHFKDMSKMIQSEHIVSFCSLIASIERCYGLWRLQEVSGARPGRSFALIVLRCSTSTMKLAKMPHKRLVPLSYFLYEVRLNSFLTWYGSLSSLYGSQHVNLTIQMSSFGC